jgi:uncharacterized protein
MTGPMARQVILTALAWICLTCASAAQTLVYPALTGRVVDGAGLLDATDRAVLTGSLANLEAKTTDQLVIVTLKSLQGTSIEDYGYQLGRFWKIGQKDKDSGALLIVAPTEHKVRIEVGYGLEGTLTDALTKIIIEQTILPKFKEGDFPGGIKNGAAEIIKVLGGDAEPLNGQVAPNTASGAKESNTGLPEWLVIVLGLVGVGVLIFCAVHGGVLCHGLFQILVLMLLFGRGGSSRGNSSFSGGGGSFGGGGSSGSW